MIEEYGLIDELQEMVYERHGLGNRLKVCWNDEKTWTEYGSTREEAAFGLVNEVGEVVQLVRKDMWDGHKLNEGEMLMELGDVLHYLLLFCSLVGVSLETVARCNLLKLDALDKGERRRFEQMMIEAGEEGAVLDDAMNDIEAALEVPR